MKKVLWILNIPSPYRIEFFNQLGRYCDLTVLFERKSSDYRDESWSTYEASSFRAIFPRSIRIGRENSLVLHIRKYLVEKYDIIVMGSYYSPTGMLAISYMCAKKIPYVLAGDGGIPASGKGIKERLKKHFIKGASMYLSTGKVHDQYYLKYGANKDNIYRYHFTSITKDDLLGKPVSSEEKKILRKELGIVEGKVVLFVGQFIHRKGIDIFLGMSDYLESDVGMYLIGGSLKSTDIPGLGSPDSIRVHDIPFLSKDELFKYFQAADVFVFPTRSDIWGLVINEALANSLPIVTTDDCMAGLELIHDGETGYVLTKADSKQFAECVTGLLKNTELINRMCENCLRVASEYTIENMVDDHIKLLSL